MTTEVRTTIEPKDIVALEIECSKCHQRIVRRLDKWLQNFTSCANCGTIWFPNKAALDALNELVAHIHGFSNGVLDQVPFTIRLELKAKTGHE